MLRHRTRAFLSLSSILVAGTLALAPMALAASHPLPTIRRVPPAVVLAGPPSRLPTALTAAAFPTAHGGAMGILAGTFSTPGSSVLSTAILGTDNGGAAWRPLATVSHSTFTALRFLDPRIGYAEGYQGKVPVSGRTAVNHMIWQTTTGGRGWHPVFSTSGSVTGMADGPAGTLDAAVAGVCTQTRCAGRIVQVGGGRPLTLWTAPGPVAALADWYGTLWALVILNPMSTSPSVAVYRNGGISHRFTRVGFVANPLRYAGPWTTDGLVAQLAVLSPHDADASLFALSTCAMGGCGVSTVYRTSTGGRTWETIPSAATNCQFGANLTRRGATVLELSSINLAACGGAMTHLLRSTDGGARFTPFRAWPDTPVTTVGFLPSGGLWALSSGALMTEGAGDRGWRQVYPGAAPAGLAVWTAPNGLYAAGDAADPAALLRSKNGGQTWAVVSSLVTRQASWMAADGETLWVAAPPLTANEYHTDPELLLSRDGGQSFAVVHTFPAATQLVPVGHMFSPKDGVVLNIGINCPAASACDNTELTTDDGGLHWVASLFPAPATLIASGAVITPRDWVLVTGGTAAAPAKIEETDDAGRTWRALATLPNNLTGGFALSFPTPRVGYMVVNDVKRGAAAGNRDALPQQADLALLATTDGGVHWTLRDLPGIPDDWSATVDFLTPALGIISSNGTLWKTTDGGRRWARLP